MNKVSITKIQSSPKAQEPAKVEPTAKVDSQEPVKAEQDMTTNDEFMSATMDENNNVACPHCAKAFKVEQPAKEEPKADTEDGDKEEKNEAHAEPTKTEPVKVEKVDPYAKGKVLKKADTAKYFTKTPITEKQKAFADRLKQSFIAGDKTNEALLNQFIK